MENGKKLNGRKEAQKAQIFRTETKIEDRNRATMRRLVNTPSRC
jgi:hypothetical protein